MSASDHAYLDDPRLSYRAKGLYAAILAHRDDAETFTTAKMIDAAQDGKDSVAAGIRELLDVGYLTRVAPRQRTGEYAGSRYHINVTT